MQTLFGALLARLRQEHGFTLRRFALTIGLDPSYYSRIERGEVAPPNEEVLARIATCHHIVVGSSPEWFELIDKADLARGRVPEFALEQDHIASMLPAFFAKLRNQPIASAEEMYRICVEIATERLQPSASLVMTDEGLVA